VLEPDSVPAALSALHESVSAVLLHLRVPVDLRTYRPHVTLARRAFGAVIKHRMDAVRWEIDHYALMSSTLGLGGGYTTVGTSCMPGS